jgi:hypothetical protein
MSSPAPRPGPGRTPVLLALLAAAVIGFLGGALAAVVGQDDGPLPTGGADATATVTLAPTPGPTAAAEASLTLTADRAQASTDELIRLEGVLRPASADVVLQVQQSVDGLDFVDFPVTATTRRDGSYGVWVRTGRVGKNEFRTVTEVDGQQVVSPPVVVSIS